MKKVIITVILVLSACCLLAGHKKTEKEDAESKKEEYRTTSFPLRAATWDDLHHACCALYVTNFPFASGVFVSVDSSCGPRICLLSAAHMALHVLKNSTNGFQIATVDAQGRHSAFLDTIIKIDKCRFFEPYDLFAVDVTEDVVRSARRNNGLSLECISINSPNMCDKPSKDWWCGVLRYNEFARYGIRLGSPCKWFGSNLWMWKQFADKKESSICLFDGSIAALPHSPTNIRTYPNQRTGQKVFVTTIPAIHGMSGGPVFALGKTSDGREYPYLIGIGISQLFSDQVQMLAYKGNISTLTNFVSFTNHVTKYVHIDNDKGSYVCPVDLFIDAMTKAANDPLPPYIQK